MYCKICGTELDDAAKFCKKCGITAQNVINSDTNNRQTESNNRLVSKKKYIVIACLSLCILILSILFVAGKNARKQPVDGIWVYDEEAKENNGSFMIHNCVPIDNQTYVYLHSDGSIQYQTSNRAGDLDSYSIVDDSFVWIRPLGTKYYYSYSLTKYKLILDDNEGNVATFIYCDSMESAKEYLESKEQDMKIEDSEVGATVEDFDIPNEDIEIKEKTDDSQEVLEHAASEMTIDDDLDAFWGIWIGSSKNEDEAKKIADNAESQGIQAEVFLTTEWENLNNEPYYVISAGTYSSEETANVALGDVREIIPDAYVKYSGENKDQSTYETYIVISSLDSIKAYRDRIEVTGNIMESNDDSKLFVVDENTIFSSDCDMESFSNYIQGDTVMNWMYKNYSISQNDETNLALLGVYDCVMSGNHIDTIKGLYWWD